MALRSRRNAQRGSVRHSDLDELANSVQGTPTAPSNAGPPDAPVSTPAPTKYTEEDLQKITKLCIDSFLQGQGSRPEPAGHREGQLKARFPDLYYGKSHIDHFCQQCEDHFDTAGATGFNRTPFAASFLRGRISFRWHQYKRRGQAVAPLPWIEFKAFLRKSLGDSRAFVDTTWGRIRRDSHHQQEEVQDWASHLEHLQSILIEFDADGAPGESALIRYFRDGLKPSIKAQMEQRGRENDSWKELVEKAIDAEAKANLQPPSFLREMDERCSQGNRPAHATMAKSQASATRDPQDEPSASSTWDPRDDSSEKIGPQTLSTWDLHDEPSDKAPAQNKLPHSSYQLFSRSENGKTSDQKARKEKKRRHRRDQARRGSVSTSVTGVNASSPSVGARKELSQVTCYNCREKGHYARNCPEPHRGGSED